MNKAIQIIKISVISMSLTSCFWSLDSGSDQIIDNYYVLWIDLKENQGITEKNNESEGSYNGLIPEYVFAVGHDNNFIIAKQHPTSGFKSGYQINTEVTNYYVIDMHAKKDKVIGPLTHLEFEQNRKELSISNMQFDMIYPESYD